MKVLVLAAIPMLAFALGWGLAKVRPAPTDEDRRELIRLREMREDLMGMASEHTMLGDTFAPIAYDRMKQTRSNQ